MSFLVENSHRNRNSTHIVDHLSLILVVGDYQYCSVAYFILEGPLECFQFWAVIHKVVLQICLEVFLSTYTSFILGHDLAIE